MASEVQPPIVIQVDRGQDGFVTQAVRYAVLAGIIAGTAYFSYQLGVIETAEKAGELFERFVEMTSEQTSLVRGNFTSVIPGTELSGTVASPLARLQYNMTNAGARFSELLLNTTRADMSGVAGDVQSGLSSVLAPVRSLGYTLFAGCSLWTGRQAVGFTSAVVSFAGRFAAR